MKKLVSKINVLLGAMIVMLTGTGCKAQKGATDNMSRKNSRQHRKEIMAERLICMYGIPAEILREQEEKEQEAREREAKEQEAKEQEAREQEATENSQTPETNVPVTPSDSIVSE